VTLAALFVVAALVLSGCGAITRYVADRIENETIERVGTVEKKVEELAEKVEAVAEEVENQVVEAVKTPLVGIIVTLIVGGLLAALCLFKFPTAVDEVIIGTVAFCAVLMVWAYRKPILWTALATAIALLGWKLVRKYVLPKIENGAD